jgi:MoxR-like ATPase
MENIKINDIFEKMQKQGYVLRREEVVALQMLLLSDGIRAVIIEGPPGCGKTSLGRSFAAATQASVVYYLCHHWTTDEELFFGVDVGKVAAGVSAPEEAYKPGALARAVFGSLQGATVLIIDEVDKAPERVENLLLDFLQVGAVYGPRGEVYKAVKENLYIFITSNGVRPLGDPLLRRCFRLRMSWLPQNVELDLLRKATGAPPGLLRLTVNVSSSLRAEGVSVSLQEMEMFLRGLQDIAKSPEDCAILVRGWLLKQPEDEEILKNTLGQNWPSVFWGEVKRR